MSETSIDWSLMKGKVFITDIQADQTVTISDKVVKLGRYAVWSPLKDDSKHTVVEVGSDLPFLQKKYKIPNNMVLKIVTTE